MCAKVPKSFHSPAPGSRGSWKAPLFLPSEEKPQNQVGCMGCSWLGKRRENLTIYTWKLYREYDKKYILKIYIILINLMYRKPYKWMCFILLNLLDFFLSIVVQTWSRDLPSCAGVSTQSVPEAGAEGPSGNTVQLALSPPGLKIICLGSLAYFLGLGMWVK